MVKVTTPSWRVTSLAEETAYLPLATNSW